MPWTDTTRAGDGEGQRRTHMTEWTRNVTMNLQTVEIGAPNAWDRRTLLRSPPVMRQASCASAINFNGTADIANAATVAIDANREIKVWGGDQAGSAHIIIDVTGYYTPPVPFPNMGN